MTTDSSNFNIVIDYNKNTYFIDEHPDKSTKTTALNSPVGTLQKIAYILQNHLIYSSQGLDDNYANFNESQLRGALESKAEWVINHTNIDISKEEREKVSRVISKIQTLLNPHSPSLIKQNKELSIYDTLPLESVDRMVHFLSASELIFFGQTSEQSKMLSERAFLEKAYSLGYPKDEKSNAQDAKPFILLLFSAIKQIDDNLILPPALYCVYEIEPESRAKKILIEKTIEEFISLGSDSIKFLLDHALNDILPNEYYLLLQILYSRLSQKDQDLLKIQNNDTLLNHMIKTTSIDEETWSYMLRLGMDVDEADRNGITPLHSAAEFLPGFLPVLLKSNPNINVRDRLGNTPLHNAQSTRSIKYLLQHGADATIVNALGKTPLMHALTLINAHYLVVCKALLQHKGDVGLTKEATPMGDNIFHLLARAPQRLTPSELQDLEDAIAKKGAFDNTTNQAGDSFLMQAIVYRPSLVPLMLEKNPKLPINRYNIMGESALTLAIQRGYVDIVKLLLDHGAQVNTKNIEGVTVLQLARQAGNKAIIDLLSSKGAK